MSTEPFIKPRFVGPRFDDHTLPLAAAKDLAAYEELVLELAKHLYRQKHQDRERVPKGFGDGFALHLEKIEAGSAKPAIVALLAGGVLFSSLPPEIAEARDLINTVIATDVRQPLPATFPKDLYGYFNRLGRSLEVGEKIEWTPDAPNNKTELTPEKRKRLVLAHRETYEAEVSIIGKVEELDAKKKTGVLRSDDGEGVGFVFDDPFFDDLRDGLGSKTVFVRFKGVGLFDVNEKLTSLTEIEQLDTLPHYTLTNAVDGLGQLKDGWIEGAGKAPTAENLAWLSNELATRFPATLEYPSVAPTEEGNVILEWIGSEARTELEVNFEERRLELYATNMLAGSFVEEQYPLDQLEAAFGKVEGLLLL